MLAVLKCFDDMHLNCLWKLWSRQNLSGWWHCLPESLCESLCRKFYDAATVKNSRCWKRLESERHCKHPQSNRIIYEHQIILMFLFGHCCFYFLFFYINEKVLCMIMRIMNNQHSPEALENCSLSSWCARVAQTVCEREEARGKRAKNAQIPQSNLNPLIHRWWHHCRTLQQRNVFEEPSTVLHLEFLLLKSRYTFSLLFFFLRSSAHNLKRKERFPFDYWIQGTIWTFLRLWIILNPGVCAAVTQVC